MKNQAIARELLRVAKVVLGENKGGNSLPFEIGDEILLGRFKNRRAIVKGFGSGKHNQPTVITTKGEVPLFRFWIPSLFKD